MLYLLPWQACDKAASKACQQQIKQQVKHVSSK
jgi:hypothetical protein